MDTYCSAEYITAFFKPRQYFPVIHIKTINVRINVVYGYVKNHNNEIDAAVVALIAFSIGFYDVIIIYIIKLYY